VHWSGYDATALDIEVDPQRCRFGGRKSDIAVCLLLLCVFYYCRTYDKAVRVGGGGEWRTCAMRDDEPRPVWMSLPSTCVLITHWSLLETPS
jgi:hypothetical protein